jgi:cardiolipin synthase
MNLVDLFKSTWPYLVTIVILFANIATAVHILYKKRDARAAAGWLGLVWFTPMLGVCLYWLFGVNRIKRRARLQFAGKKMVGLPEKEAAVSPHFVEAMFPGDDLKGMAEISRITDKITRQPLMQGNRITPLINGDQAFPKMLTCIEEAHHSITLCSYIFDNDAWGKRFRSALSDARKRGLDVKVLIDGAGARYSIPPITWGLRRDGVDVATFMQTILPWRFIYLNLRNHRKILVIDGRVGFTGGMNIRAGNCLADNPAHPVQDLHFFIEGPVVAELQRAFAEDWTFTTSEVLEGEKWYPHVEPLAKGVARGISDGPDEDFDKLRMVILGAITSAKSSIKIASPYFLPDGELVTSLRIAALRGVDVKILLPGTSNLRMVKWASDACLEELLKEGCRIYLSQSPFDHSKLMVVDDTWVLLGSANWDSRSLALNFEFNIECYDVELAKAVSAVQQEKVDKARELTLQTVRSKKLIIKLRNNFFRLFSPYL